jgi:hypothetical protein
MEAPLLRASLVRGRVYSLKQIKYWGNPAKGGGGGGGDGGGDGGDDGGGDGGDSSGDSSGGAVSGSDVRGGTATALPERDDQLAHAKATADHNDVDTMNITLEF